MAVTRIIGNDGSVTLPTGTHDGIVQRYNVQFPRVSTDVTGFGDSLVRHRLGVSDIRGSLDCIMKFDASSTSPGVSDRVVAGSALTLVIQTGCSYALTAAMQNVTIDSAKQGDATLRYDFENGDSDTLTETWDESP